MSVCRIAGNKLRTTPIIAVRNENSATKTFVFKDRECGRAKPGQFLMLWIPGVDEIPLSIASADEDGVVSVAVKSVGDATRALQSKRIGDLIGVRGPFGTSFTSNRGRIMMVGGGTGIAPLSFLARRLTPKARRLVFIMGARTRDEVLFMTDLKRLLKGAKRELVVTTEDGSCGITALCTDPLEGFLAREKFEVIYTCGPEPMIRKIFDLARAHRVPFEASLERLMRCAIGLCGSCVIGKYRVCRDGPVFRGEQLEEVSSEFGVLKRDFDGKKIPV